MTRSFSSSCRRECAASASLPNVSASVDCLAPTARFRVPRLPGIIHHLVDRVEEAGQRAAQVPFGRELVEHHFQVAVDLLLHVGVCPIAARATSRSCTNLIQLLHDAVDQHARAENQVAVHLHRRRHEDRFLPHVAGRVGVGNIIAHHVQANLHGLQRVAAHLNRAEETHAHRREEWSAERQIVEQCSRE